MRIEPICGYLHSEQLATICFVHESPTGFQKQIAAWKERFESENIAAIVARNVHQMEDVRLNDYKKNEEKVSKHLSKKHSQ